MAEAQAAIAFSVDRHVEQFGKAWKPAALPQPSDLAVAPTKGSPGMQTLRPLRVLLLSVPILLTPLLDIAPWMICLVSVWILLEAEPCAALLCSLPRKTRKASTSISWSTLNQRVPSHWIDPLVHVRLAALLCVGGFRPCVDDVSAGLLKHREPWCYLACRLCI